MDLTHRFRDCSCPGTPHPGGDTVTFPARLDFDSAARAVGAIFDGDGPASAQKAFRIYLHAPLTWNVVDENGPVPLTREALDALDFADQYEIADYGDTLYQQAVLSPLLRRTSASSASGSTTDTPRRRSKS
jgi:hypothetical protein